MNSLNADPKMKLDGLLDGVRYRASMPLSTRFDGLVSDSREVQPGQVFACIEEGDRVESYLAEAFEKGAVAALVEERASIQGGQIVEVENLGKNLSQIAGNFYGHPSQNITVVGVTGTNGKSTVCSWIEQLLELNGRAAGSIGTLGVHVRGEQLLEPDGMTTRDPIRAQQVLKFCRDAGAEAIAMEVSSHGMHQHRVESVCFGIALFTNFSRDHLDYHETENEYWKAKKRLFDLPGIRCAVVNVDDPKGRELSEELEGSMELVRFSIEGREQADIYLTDLEFDRGFQAQLNSKWGSKRISMPQMTAEFELSNLLAALAATCYMGVSLEQALSKITELQPARGRLELVGDFEGSKVYVDYAHTPDAVKRVLSALKATVKNQLICVLGCGGDRDSGKRPLMTQAVLSVSDQMIITSDNPRSEAQDQIEQDMLKGAQDRTKVDCIQDRRAAIKFAIENAGENSCVAVLGKGHERGQVFAGRVEPFCDIDVVKELLEEIRLEASTKGEAKS